MYSGTHPGTVFNNIVREVLVLLGRHLLVIERTGTATAV